MDYELLLEATKETPKDTLKRMSFMLDRDLDRAIREAKMEALAFGTIRPETISKLTTCHRNLVYFNMLLINALTEE